MCGAWLNNTMGCLRFPLTVTFADLLDRKDRHPHQLVSIRGPRLNTATAFLLVIYILT